MTITVKISGLPSCGPKTIRADGIANIRLRDLLAKHMPIERQSLFEVILSHGKLKPGYVILVNGRNISQLDGLDTIIKDNEAVLIAAHVVGG